MFLSKINVKDCSLCTFCNNDNETLKHLFWECDFVEAFWLQCCNLCLKGNFDLNYDHVKFGYLDEATHPINFFILNAKYYIFCCKLNSKTPDATAFYYKLKYYLQVEYYILRKANNEYRLSLFNDVFKE